MYICKLNTFSPSNLPHPSYILHPTSYPRLEILCHMCANNPTFNLKVVSKGKGGTGLLFQRLHEQPPPGQSSCIELGSNMKLWFYLHDNLWWSRHQCNLSSHFTSFPIHVTFKPWKKANHICVSLQQRFIYVNQWTQDPLQEFCRVVPTALGRPMGEVFNAADAELYTTDDLSVGEVNMRLKITNSNLNNCINLPPKEVVKST